MADAKLTVLLDLDGTLTDSRPGILASYRATLRALGHEPDPTQDMTHVIGPPVEHAMTRILAHYGDDRVAEAATMYRAHYGEHGLFDNSVYDGIPAAMDTLRAAGVTLMVATAKRTVFARPILERFGLATDLAAIYGSEPGGALDVKADLITHIVAEQQLDPARTVMVGDRRYDITGAHASRMRGVGVLWGYGTRAELEEAGADALAEHPTDLAALVLAQLHHA